MGQVLRVIGESLGDEDSRLVESTGARDKRSIPRDPPGRGVNMYQNDTIWASKWFRRGMADRRAASLKYFNDIFLGLEGVRGYSEASGPARMRPKPKEKVGV